MDDLRVAVAEPHEDPVVVLDVAPNRHHPHPRAAARKNQAACEPKDHGVGLLPVTAGFFRIVALRVRTWVANILNYVMGDPEKEVLSSRDRRRKRHE